MEIKEIDLPGRIDAEGHIDSYHVRSAGPLQRYPAARGRIACETCVVGGGLAGLATAHQLSRAGREVAVIEGERIGWAASGRNGGFVSPGYAESILTIERKVGLAHARELYRLSVEGVEFIRDMTGASDRPGIVGGKGWLKMIRNADSDGLKRGAERMARDYGATLTFVDRAALSRHVSSPVYRAGLLDMTPFHIQPLDFVSLLAFNASASGTRIFEGARCLALERMPGGWRLRTREATIEADNVVVATSAYGGPSRRINAMMQPVATFVATARRPAGSFDDAIRFKGCLGDTRRASDYYRLIGPEDAPQLLWGGGITRVNAEPRDLGGRIRRYIANAYPQLADVEIDCAWSGLMGYARHRMPLIGRLREGLWVVSGFGGHGLNTSVSGGALVAAAIASGDDRFRLFQPFGMVWAGGPAGAVAVQAEYLRLRVADWLAERMARGGGDEKAS